MIQDLFWRIIRKLQYYIQCKLGIFKIPLRMLDEAKLRKNFENTAMISVLETVAKTNKYDGFRRYFDYSHNKNISFSSDYGGEDALAKFNTYTFTFHTYSSLVQWLKSIEHMLMIKDYSFTPPKYSDIKPATRDGKLRDWLRISVQHFKGIIVSFAVDKKIDSLFAPSKEELLKHIKSYHLFRDCTFSPQVLEKAFRIANFSCLILAYSLEECGGYFWMTDRDAINQKDDKWRFMVKLHDFILRMYCEHLICVKKGYALPFSKEDEFSKYFLSLSDLISGAIDDFCNCYVQGYSPEDMYRNLKGKTIEIINAISVIPSFIYVIEKTKSGGNCKRILIQTTGE